MQITVENAVEYARGRGLLTGNEQPRVETLTGGVACTVLRLHAARGAIVIKQAQERFRVKEEWLVDTRRNALEARFQRLARSVLGPEHVPEVLDVDAGNCAFTMESAPLNAKNWKTMMLTGDVRPELGAQCGELLRKLHALPHKNFLRNKALFYQQRIEPYFVFTATRHPDVATELASLSAKLMAAGDAVTHGDFTPKNFLVSDGTLILLDYEVVHWGWPEFDVASLVNHLVLKMVHRPQSRDALLATLRQFLSVQQPREGWLQCLGGLMLARVDGKSPVEYLGADEKQVVRGAAKELLRGRIDCFDEFYVYLKHACSGL